jgi:site-specific DNA-cytosine methylase
MIRLATVFSGIGAPEEALRQLNEDYEIVFACDNGERELKDTYEQIVEATKDMAPVYGKAFVHREKLHGVPDQGAIVGSLLYKAWTEAL